MGTAASELSRTMLVEWNSTHAAYPTTTCMHELFEQRVAATPERVALVCGTEQLTYRELNRRANQLARHLQGLGVGPDVLVGICMHRRLELIVAILGTLKAGGAYVPLDPTYPQKRLAAMVADVDLRVLLTTENLLAMLPEHRARVLCLDRDWATVAEESADDGPTPASVNNLAYVIFTSGSTGKPKAAAVYHRGWTNLMHWFVTEFAVAAADRVLVVSSFSFDITQRSIVMPLISGAQLHLLASAVHDPALILQTIRDQRITLMNCSPSTFYPLIEGAHRVQAAALRSVRIVFLGGEAISASRLREWAESPECATELVNVYGAAECSDVSTFYRLRDYPRYVQSSVPIGTPIFNSQVYLLDEHLQPVPFGSPGEICIAGDGVGRGYINDEALTNEKFVPSPFSDAPAARLYRTGDLGRFLPDWNLEFIGRVDHQVKVRGFRIDLGDVEAALRQHPGVTDAVVLRIEYALGDQRLVAYVVRRQRAASPDERAWWDELRRFAKDRLPEYMVPNEFRALEALPLNPNGKVDREALLALDVASSVEAGIDQPRTALEEQVAAVFAKVLKLERVGIFDNFFDLGGHSSLLTEAMAELIEPSGGRLDILDFLSGPTVAELAKRIESCAEPPAPPAR